MEYYETKNFLPMDGTAFAPEQVTKTCMARVVPSLLDINDLCEITGYDAFIVTGALEQAGYIKQENGVFVPTKEGLASGVVAGLYKGIVLYRSSAVRVID